MVIENAGTGRRVDPNTGKEILSASASDTNGFNGAMNRFGAIAPYLPAVASAFSPAPGSINSNYYGPEQLNQAIDFYNQYGQQANAFNQTPFGGPGGTSIQQPYQVDKRTQTRDAFIQYRLSKGDSQADATKKADAVIANPDIAFNEKKGFVDFVRSGGAPGLSLNAEGGINAAPKYVGGGVNTATDPYLNSIRGLGQEGINAASGLAPLYGQEAASSLAFRDQLRGNLANQFSTPTNINGLTDAEEGDLNAQEAALMQDLATQNNTNARGVLATFSKFPSSSLLPEQLSSGVFDPQSRFLTQAYGALSNNRQNILNQGAARRTQAQTNVINASNSLGNPMGLNQVTAGVMSPGAAGLFTDPQAAALSAEIQQNAIKNNQINYGYGSDIYSRGVTLPTSPSSGGFGSALAGAGAGATVGSAFGPMGTAIGGGLGGLYGFFK